MYTAIKGILTQNKLLKIEVLLASGMSVGVVTPMRLNHELEGKIGTEVSLPVHTIYKEDSITMYGFKTASERDLFEYIINTVGGVGAKTAVGLLNRFSPEDFVQNVVEANPLAFSKCPGIGAKTAETIIFDLKDKTGKLYSIIGSTSKGSVASDIELEAVQALVVLGIGEGAAKKKVKELLKADPKLKVEDLVTKALT